MCEASLSLASATHPRRGVVRLLVVCRTVRVLYVALFSCRSTLWAKQRGEQACRPQAESSCSWRASVLRASWGASSRARRVSAGRTSRSGGGCRSQVPGACVWHLFNSQPRSMHPSRGCAGCVFRRFRCTQPRRWRRRRRRRRQRRCIGNVGASATSVRRQRRCVGNVGASAAAALLSVVALGSALPLWMLRRPRAASWPCVCSLAGDSRDIKLPQFVLHAGNGKDVFYRDAGKHRDEGE